MGATVESIQHHSGANWSSTGESHDDGVLNERQTTKLDVRGTGLEDFQLLTQRGRSDRSCAGPPVQVSKGGGCGMGDGGVSSSAGRTSSLVGGPQKRNEAEEKQERASVVSTGLARTCDVKVKMCLRIRDRRRICTSEVSKCGIANFGKSETTAVKV